MKTISTLLAVAALLTACGQPQPTCSARNCATGCCDSTGVCLSGSAVAACGSNGQSCDVCVGSQVCNQGVCQLPNGGGMGGGGGGGGTIDAGPPQLRCQAGFTACFGSCADTTNDTTNCGGCNTRCASNQSCVAGVCATIDCTINGCPDNSFCDTASKQCRAGCATTNDCPAQAACSNGRCVCDRDFTLCGTRCEPNDSISACGATCARCDGLANAVGVCTRGTCDFTCNSGTHRCGGE
ncbi:MAG: hypothetical protein JNG84_11375 [Archangium sp.]|nr:hypothetical protein [Archangium sp.]